VLVDEPSVEDTIAILRGLQERYEVHHGVDITDPAIVAAATLSHRYIADRQLPDKAIDLIDEAAARIRMEIDSKPEALDRLERRIIQLKIEREALKKEQDEASKRRLATLQETLSALEKSTPISKRSGNRKRPHYRALPRFAPSSTGFEASSMLRAVRVTCSAWPNFSTARSPSSRNVCSSHWMPRTRPRNSCATE